MSYTSLSPAQMHEQIEAAHSRLDDLGVPRRGPDGHVTLTVRGRLDWLSDRVRTESCPDASNDHRCLTWNARWTPQHPDDPKLNGIR